LTEPDKIPMPEKGKSLPLLYSREARQRVFVSVSWDARMQSTRPGRKSKPAAPVLKKGADIPEAEGYENLNIYRVEGEVGFVTETFDIDLVCLIFNAAGELVDAVSPDPRESMDRSGKIYHGGDETRGISDSDDETVTVELKDLPDSLHHLVFVAICQSGQSFDRIAAPHAHVTDGLTGVDVLDLDIGKPDGPGKTACILMRLHRGGPEGWMLHNICAFRVDKAVSDWGQEVRPFLT
jgi:stress response protein SCP2